MSEQAVFPFQITDHWELVTSTLTSIDTWTPDILIDTLYNIYQSSVSPDKPFITPARQKFAKLLELLDESKKCTDTTQGSVDEVWGGAVFDGSKETLPRITAWFLQHTLPFISQLLLELPALFPDKIALCTKSNTTKMELTKRQCAALLAMMFFCANHINCMPYPVDNFQSLVNFDVWLKDPYFTNRAKLYMMLNYFERSRVCIKDEVFEIKRLQLKPTSLTYWTCCDLPLSVFHAHSTGGITETAGGEVLHVDFANAYIGGGVLGGGAVQEEIMFSVCPELLTFLLFCSKMEDSEALLLVNAEQFSVAKGYNMSLKYGGDFRDTTHTSRVAIDAVCYGWGRHSKDDQFLPHQILRDLNKAKCGFDNEYPAVNSGIATGNWGCGAFGGNIQLKSMLQWCAASSVFRDLHYYTFNDKGAAGMEDITQFLYEKDVTVAQLIREILDYADLRTKKSKTIELLFDFLKGRFSKID